MNKSFNTLAEFEFESLKKAANYRNWIGQRFKASFEGASNVLEVGSGIGQFTQIIQQYAEGAAVTALEPEIQFHDELKISAPNAEHLNAYSSELVGHRSFDAIASVNVLEHIEDDIAELKNWHALLKPGGRVCLLVPAHPEIYASIDNLMGHYRRYTKRSMTDKIESAGLQITELYYFNFLGYWLWLLNFKVFKRKTIDAKNVAFFDRVLIHFSKIMDLIRLNAFKGQSLICIARKPT
ncbi:MAG: class I SAM-dependent methyltransferase [Verrucomicrobiota bacterium]